MKAIVQDRYGPPDVLRYAEVDRPEPAAGEVRVRVHAAAVNAYDWHMMRGDPYVLRLVFGRRPGQPIRGRDVAGRVDAVGDGVAGFEPGDEVYADLGDRQGAFAEYVCVPARQVARKPAGLSFAEAAAMPLAATTALVCLRDAAGLTAGRRLLINGASGGVGTFAIQLGKVFGAEVTAVCRARNAELASKLGADRVIDYTTTDFTAGPGRYDVLLDLVGNRSLGDLRRVLTPAGTLLLSGGGVSTGGSLFGPLALHLRGRLAALVSRRQRLLAPGPTPGRDNLDALRDLVEAGRLTPVVDRTYPLAEAADAIRYVETEHARAKVVLTVG